MPAITYLSPDGTRRTIEVAEDATVMRTAITNGIRGIIGECGGQAMCATCHVYVEEAPDTLPPISDEEEEMLECTAAERLPESRLGCQLRALDFDRITVRLPETQV